MDAGEALGASLRVLDFPACSWSQAVGVVENVKQEMGCLQTQVSVAKGK
jgi:hypothetical protein